MGLTRDEAGEVTFSDGFKTVFATKCFNKIQSKIADDGASIDVTIYVKNGEFIKQTLTPTHPVVLELLKHGWTRNVRDAGKAVDLDEVVLQYKRRVEDLNAGRWLAQRSTTQLAGIKLHAEAWHRKRGVTFEVALKRLQAMTKEDYEGAQGLLASTVLEIQAEQVLAKAKAKAEETASSVDADNSALDDLLA